MLLRLEIYFKYLNKTLFQIILDIYTIALIKKQNGEDKRRAKINAKISKLIFSQFF